MCKPPGSLGIFPRAEKQSTFKTKSCFIFPLVNALRGVENLRMLMNILDRSIITISLVPQLDTYHAGQWRTNDFLSPRSPYLNTNHKPPSPDTTEVQHSRFHLKLSPHQYSFQSTKQTMNTPSGVPCQSVIGSNIYIYIYNSRIMVVTHSTCMGKLKQHN